MNDNEYRLITKNIGKSIKEFRRLANMSVIDLSRKTGISDGHIRNIESGTCASLYSLLSITEVLNIPAYVLFSASSDPPVSNISDDVAIEIFVRIYSSCSSENQKLLLRIVEAFGKNE